MSTTWNQNQLFSSKCRDLFLISYLSLHGCVAPPHGRRRGLRGLDQGAGRRGGCRRRRSCEHERGSRCLLLQDGDEEDKVIKHSSSAADV